jgi:hypothetical protein
LYTYSDFAKQAMKNYHTLEKNDDKSVARIFKKLKLENLGSTDEKVFTIEAYIKNDIGTIENPGELSMSECLEKKGLSKFYQNKLTCLLLEKCGISYEVIGTSDRTDKVFDPDFESYSFLTDILFYIPETKKYFSYENIIYRYGLTPPSACNQLGLFVKPILIGEAYSAINSIKKIDGPGPGISFDNLNIDMSIDPNKNKITENLSRSLQGYPAAGSRAYYYYNNAGKREEYLKELLNMGVENATVSLASAANYELNDFKKYNLPFTCTGIVETKHMTETAGNNIIFKIGLAIGPQSELYQEEKRIYPIYTIYPHSYKRSIQVDIPDGYVVEGIEKLIMNKELKSSETLVAFFKSTAVIIGNKISIEVEESYLQAFYAKDEFEGFRKIINAAADFNKVSLLLKKK